MASYDRGDRVRFQAEFVNVAGAAADPTTVKCKIKKPDLSTVTYTGTAGGLTNPSTGTWYIDDDIDQEGKWFYRFEGLGAVVAAAEGNLGVNDSRFY